MGGVMQVPTYGNLRDFKTAAIDHSATSPVAGGSDFGPAGMSQPFAFVE